MLYNPLSQIIKPTFEQIAALHGRYWTHPRYEGCVGHWMLGEGGGNVAYDLSHHNRSGAWSGSARQYDIDNFGLAGSFNAIDSHIEIPAIDIPTDFTWMAWIRTLPASTLRTNLIAFWNLEEVSGTRFDSVGSNDLVDNNTVTQAVGKISNAASFDRANSEYLSLADNTDLSTGDIDWTIAVWVKLTTKDTQIIVAKDDTNNQREFNLDYFSGDDEFRVFVTSDGTNSTITFAAASTFGSPSIGVWYFIVISHDATANTISIQINNGAIDSSAHSGGSFDGTAPFAIGAQFSSGTPANFANNLTDAVGFWKKVLTTDEKSLLFNRGIGRQMPLPTSIENNLIAFWNLGEANGATRVDSVGSNNLADTNTVTQETGKIGKSAGFVAASAQLLSIADNADLSTGDIDFTFACWLYLEAKPGAPMRIAGKYNFSGDQREWLLLWDDAADRYQFVISELGTGASNVVVTANNFGAPPVKTFALVVIWHDSVANTINIQVNNGAIDSTAHAGGVFDSSASFTLGNSIDIAGYWDGRIDAAGFWKKVLTPQEKTIIYNDGFGREMPFIPTFMTLMSKTTDPWAATGVQITINANGEILIDSFGIGNFIITGVGVNDGERHLIGFTFVETDSILVYLDGVQVGSGTLALTPAANHPMWIGKLPLTAPDGQWWTNMIEEVRIYDRAVNAAGWLSFFNEPFLEFELDEIASLFFLRVPPVIQSRMSIAQP